MMRINIGCGQTPTKGWRNFDNSPSLWLARVSLLPKLLRRVGFLDEAQYRFIQFAHANAVEHGDAVKGLPLPDGSVDVVYACHMFEHLDRQDAVRFLAEARRILRPAGIIRLVVPDIQRQVQRYLESRDADEFIAGTMLAQPRPRSFARRLAALLFGTRHHQWMYDGASLCRLLADQGFVGPVIMPAGATGIGVPEGLDLMERADGSVCVEAKRP